MPTEHLPVTLVMLHPTVQLWYVRHLDLHRDLAAGGDALLYGILAAAGEAAVAGGTVSPGTFLLCLVRGRLEHAEVPALVGPLMDAARAHRLEDADRLRALAGVAAGVDKLRAGRTDVCTEPVSVVVATWDFSRVVAVAHLWTEPAMLADHADLHDLSVQVAKSIAGRLGVCDTRSGVALGHVPIEDAPHVLACLKEGYAARGGVPHSEITVRVQ